MSTSAPSPDHILQIGLGFWASKTLLSAVEMEVFTELAKHPEDLNTLTGRLGLHPRSSRDFFDALVALGFLERKDGIYSNTPSTDLFLDKHKPSYIGGMLEMANQRLYHALEQPDHGSAHRPAARRGGTKRDGDLRRSLRRSGAAEELSGRHDRREPGRQHGHRRQVSVGEVQDRCRCWARRRAICWRRWR